jgi:hypothetical protein
MCWPRTNREGAGAGTDAPPGATLHRALRSPRIAARSAARARASVSRRVGPQGTTGELESLLRRST